MKVLKRVGLGALVLVPLAILLWQWFGPKPSVYFTDGISVRQEGEGSSPRTVVWDAPELLVAAMNEEGDSFDPCFSADGRTLVFARGRPKQNADLYIMWRESAGWSAPQALSVLNTEADEMGPELSRDGTLLYFYSDRPGGAGGYDLWVSRRTGGGDWGAAVNLGPAVNSEFAEYDPAVAPGGDRLYFSSNRPKEGDLEAQDRAKWKATLRGDASGFDFDIFVADLAPPAAEGGLAMPEGAERMEQLNTAAHEGQVALTERGDFLYFSSDREGGQGGFDLYRSRLLHGEIAEPQNLGAPINSEGDEMDPSLWMEGFGLAFSSDRGTPEGEQFTLFHTLTREVMKMEDPHWFWGSLDKYKWLLIGAVVALFLALLLMRHYFGAESTLIQRCLAGSVIAHLVLLVLFAFWKMAEQVIEAQRKSSQILVDSDNLAEEKLALNIRETVTELPPVKPNPDQSFRSPPPRDLNTPKPPTLPPAPVSEQTKIDPDFAAALQEPEPEAVEQEVKLEEAPQDVKMPALEVNEPLETEFDKVALEENPDREVEADAELKPAPEAPMNAPRSVRPVPDPSANAPKMANAEIPKAAPAPSRESAANEASAPPVESDTPAPAAPEFDSLLSLEALAGGTLPEPDAKMEEGPSGEVHEDKKLEPAPDSGSKIAKNESEPAAESGGPRAEAVGAEASQERPEESSAMADAAGSVAVEPAVELIEEVPLIGLPDLEFEPELKFEEMVEFKDPFLLRSAEMRERMVEDLGGSEETEKAIRGALDWFTRHQEGDGRWKIARFGGRGGHDTACTAMALLCYMGWNADHRKETPYRGTVAKGVTWLLAQEKELNQNGTIIPGDFRGKGDMYDQGIVTIALAELYAMTKDAELRLKLERAVQFILAAQNKQTGGWRYGVGQGASDTSVVGWQVMALRSARQSGLEVPEAAFEGARKWLNRVGGGKAGGLYGYTDRNPKPAMVAEGMFCQQLMGVPREHPRMVESARYLSTALPKQNATSYYYWYYGALALYQHKGATWESWNDRIKPILTQSQVTAGGERGSWKPEGQHGKDAGRAVVTAMATLTLEVYYRYLPMYGGKGAE